MSVEYKNSASKVSSTGGFDLLSNNWDFSLSTTGLDRYLLPLDLPPDCAVLPAYNRTVRLSNSSTEEVGTGIILRDQLLLTCSHVIARLTSNHSFKEICAKTALSESTLSNATIEINDEKLDFAIIKCPDLRAYSAISVETDTSLYLSDSCYLIGNPVYATLGRPEPKENIGQTISVGRIEELRNGNIHVYAPTINPGYSGGPILSRAGSLLGIISEQYGFGGRGPLISTILDRSLE